MMHHHGLLCTIATLSLDDAIRSFDCRRGLAQPRLTLYLCGLEYYCFCNEVHLVLYEKRGWALYTQTAISLRRIRCVVQGSCLFPFWGGGGGGVCIVSMYLYIYYILYIIDSNHGSSLTCGGNHQANPRQSESNIVPPIQRPKNLVDHHKAPQK